MWALATLTLCPVPCRVTVSPHCQALLGTPAKPAEPCGVQPEPRGCVCLRSWCSQPACPPAQPPAFSSNLPHAEPNLPVPPPALVSYSCMRVCLYLGSGDWAPARLFCLSSTSPSSFFPPLISSSASCFFLPPAGLLLSLTGYGDSSLFHSLWFGFRFSLSRSLQESRGLTLVPNSHSHGFFSILSTPPLGLSTSDQQLLSLAWTTVARTEGKDFDESTTLTLTGFSLVRAWGV